MILEKSEEILMKKTLNEEFYHYAVNYYYGYRTAVINREHFNNTYDNKHHKELLKAFFKSDLINYHKQRTGVLDRYTTLYFPATREWLTKQKVKQDEY